MCDVRQGVLNLLFRQRAVRPVGKAHGFIDPRLGQLRDQRFIAHRFAKAADHGGDLGIEHGLRDLAGHVVENLDILTGGVEHLEGGAVVQEVEQRLQIDASIRLWE